MFYPSASDKCGLQLLLQIANPFSFSYACSVTGLIASSIFYTFNVHGFIILFASSFSVFPKYE